MDYNGRKSIVLDICGGGAPTVLTIGSTEAANFGSALTGDYRVASNALVFFRSLSSNALNIGASNGSPIFASQPTVISIPSGEAPGFGGADKGYVWLTRLPDA